MSPAEQDRYWVRPEDLLEIGVRVPQLRQAFPFITSWEFVPDDGRVYLNCWSARRLVQYCVEHKIHLVVFNCHPADEQVFEQNARMLRDTYDDWRLAMGFLPVAKPVARMQDSGST